MPKQKPQKNNLQLAAIFVVVVLGLIFLSLIFRIILVVKDSKFDGNHKFNVLLVGSNDSSIASFSPKPRSVSIVKIPSSIKNAEEFFEIPVDGIITANGKINTKQLSTTLIKSAFPLGSRVEKLTLLDLFRLALFARTVPQNSTFYREITDGFSSEQVNTIVSLTFSDPTVYEENLSVEIINASSINGMGARIANFITNLGGNPVLVTSNPKDELKSKILYFGKESYTVKRVSSYYNIPAQMSEKRGIADVIIIIGKDIGKYKKF